MHILDIVQNSISAGATLVTLTVDESPAEDLLTIAVGDNGRGMTPEQVSRLADPFFTSRTTRRVGMGIPLLMDSARQSGGDVRIESEPGKGTEVTAVFGYSNIDRPPLGDVANALMLLVSSRIRIWISSSHTAMTGRSFSSTPQMSGMFSGKTRLEI